MKRIAVIGLGKVGSLVGTFLNKQFNVTGLDQKKPNEALSFNTIEGNINNETFLNEFLSKQDAVVSCLPYNMNLPVAKAAHQIGIHYFDLTEDVPTTNAIREMAKTSKAVMAPQCGLAPGHNGQRKMVPSLDGIEMINIGGQEFEAFSTSGGLGTMCETLEGKVDTLNYKTIRYRGHAKLMRFLLYELILKEKREMLEEILTEAKPAVKEDVVYVYAAVEGWKNDQIFREEFYAAYHPILVDGKEWRAISWTTAATVAALV